MRSRWIALGSCIAVVAVSSIALVGDTGETEPLVIVVPIDGIIDLGMAALVERAVTEAAASEADTLLLDMNTLGGRVDAAILIRDALVGSEVPTITFIHPRAISAGAFISLACQKIAMAPGGTIGAATPVVGAGGDEMEAADEKVVSYWRSEMRATAEQNGRSGEIAEAMVDRDVEIEGVSEKGKLLTLTTAEALRLGVADFEAGTVAEVLEQLGLQGGILEERRLNWAERIARALSHPVLSSMFISLGFLGILIELYQPGWGIPGSLGVACLVAFFFGHYVVRLAGWEEIILFAVGLMLLALELIVIPGFGVAGIAGIAAILISVFLALIGLDLRTSWQLGFVSDAFTVTASSLVVVVVGGAAVMRFLPHSRVAAPFVLQHRLAAKQGYVSHATGHEERYPPGTRGKAVGDLRPSGTIRIEHDRVDAISEGELIHRGTPVVIVAWRAGQPVVRPLEESETDVAPEKDS
jgi:membrane-bound serine protease (ClpP class)